MSIDTDYAVLREVLRDHVDTQGWAAEFGVYTGYSLKIIADHMPVIGFDSFKGLPEDWRPGFPKGRFGPGDGPSLGVNLLPPANAMIVPGWFCDTVPQFPFPPLSLVHIDCDLYSSTDTALNGVLPYVGDGTVLVFDEFHGYPGAEHHEEKAFNEWVIANEVTAIKIAHGEQEAAFVIYDINNGGLK